MIGKRGELLEHGRSVFDQSLRHAARACGAGRLMGAGRDVLFDIDWQGTQQLKEKAGSDLVTVFILPPSTRDLERRLITRAQDLDGKSCRSGWPRLPTR